jgi:hypothetical protein
MKSLQKTVMSGRGLPLVGRRHTNLCPLFVGRVLARSAALLAVALLLVSGPGVRSGFAQDRSPTRRNPIEQDNSDRILVMKNGGVVRGRLRTVSNGYIVSSKNGYVLIPFNQVDFDSDNVEEAWFTMRLRVKTPTVASHLKIARWCLSQKLPRGAVRELREALDLDPSNETARLMLRRVDDQMRRQAIAAEDNSGRPKAFISVNAVRQPDDARSLAGLSPRMAQRFVAQIQPLLLNRCGNARCHGSATTKREFKLEHRRGTGSHRRQIERNLGAVLRNLDLGRPGDSKLLSAGLGVHGGRTIFNGPAGAKQFKLIRDWATTAATELRPADLKLAARPDEEAKTTGIGWGDLASSARRSAPRSRIPETPKFDLTGEPAVSLSEFVGAGPAATAAPRYLAREGQPVRSRDSEALKPEDDLSSFQKLLRETNPAKDAFDPDRFNRQYVR